jgi:hypothetical protein
MRYLLLSSCLLLLLSCAGVHKNLQTQKGDVSSILKFKPSFSVALYKTEVNVTGKYLSGLLLMKQMPDSSLRMVFSNEMGFKFFDFAFLPDGSFQVFTIIKQMDKKAVITTLRKDFELVLMRGLDPRTGFIRSDSQYVFHIFPQSKGFYQYITNKEGDELVRMERASKTKVVVEAIATKNIGGVPDSIGITHKTFNFTIGLKRIVQ